METFQSAIDGETLESHIDGLADFGETGGDVAGLFRPVYSPSWVGARDMLERSMSEAELATRVDAVGNLFGRLEGSVDGPVVLSGSHVDTVRDGGKYDGALGIHAALAAVAAIQRSGCTPYRPIEVVALCEEEGSRFSSPMWGTQAILGLVSNTDCAGLVDQSGVSISDAMSQVGLDAGRIRDAARDDLYAFVELHIEQGGILEADGRELGVVTTIAGQQHLSVEVHGRQNHAGTTPMDLRRDALAGVAEMLGGIERIGREMGRPAVATVGQVSVEPGSRNVIPGRVQFTVDARHPESEGLQALLASIQEVLENTARSRDLAVKVDQLFHRAPTPMDPGIVSLLDHIAARHGRAMQMMPSGAGHDSQLFAEHVPTGMIFTPSIDGISHSPLEFTPIEMIVPCVAVLADALWELANRQPDR